MPKKSEFMEVNIIVYPTADINDPENTNRIEYNGYVIQLIAQEYSMWSCVIDPDGDDVVYESRCLHDAMKWIDLDKKKRAKKIENQV